MKTYARLQERAQGLKAQAAVYGACKGDVDIDGLPPALPRFWRGVGGGGACCTEGFGQNLRFGKEACRGMGRNL